MKVLYILEKDLISKKAGTIGGVKTHVRGVVEAFHKRGDEVVFVSPSPIPFLDNKIYRHIKLEYPRYFIPKISGLWSQWKTINFIIHMIKKELPDMIYTRWPGNIFFYKIRKKFPGLPIIAECNTPRGMSDNGGIFNKMILYFQDKQNLYNATVISAVSEEISDYFRHRFNYNKFNKIIVNPNGVNHETFSYVENNIREKYNIPGTIPLIGFTGYFSPWHRIDILIKAVQSCKYDTRLLVIGKGPEKLENELKELSNQVNRERIIFTGSVPFERIPSYLSACDILVVPQDKNRPHGSSIKLFEYMSIGKAIAAANVGQLAQVVKNNVNGILFEPDPESLKKTLEILISDTALRVTLGEKARKDAIEKYSWEANVSRIINALNDVNSQLTG